MKSIQLKEGAIPQDITKKLEECMEILKKLVANGKLSQEEADDIAEAITDALENYEVDGDDNELTQEDDEMGEDLLRRAATKLDESDQADDLLGETAEEIFDFLQEGRFK